MKLKPPSVRARRSRAAKRRASHGSEAKVRPVQPEAQQRIWSLLLPPGFPTDRQ